jgi:hypothetical protein
MIWTHLSELRIDRMLAGELTPGETAAMRDHAVGCQACDALLDGAIAAQRAFASAHRPLLLPIATPITAARARRRTAVFATAGALAAAAALLLVWPRGDAAAVRTKGGPMIGGYVSHDGLVYRVGQDERVMPGDRLELFTTATQPGWFAAISDDARGTRSVYVEPRFIEAGPEEVVPLSIELDGTLGREVVAGIFCAAPIDMRAIEPASPPAGCTVDRLALVKVAK